MFNGGGMSKKEIESSVEYFLPLSAAEKTELDRRLAGDDATPNDTVAWETIKAEAQIRWQ